MDEFFDLAWRAGHGLPITITWPWWAWVIAAVFAAAFVADLVVAVRTVVCSVGREVAVIAGHLRDLQRRRRAATGGGEPPRG